MSDKDDAHDAVSHYIDTVLIITSICFSGLPLAPIVQYFSSPGIFVIPGPSISVESLE